MDPNVRLSKLDYPEVVDPLLHRKYRSIVECLSYLVNMTRPDLAFSFSQLSKFLQYPGEAHLTAAYRVLAYVKRTLHQGLLWHDPGAGSRNKLSGWVDSVTRLLLLLGSRHTTRPAHAGVGGHHTTVSSLFFIAYPQK